MKNENGLFTELKEKLLETLSPYDKVEQNPDELTETEKLIKANEEACSTATKEFHAADTAHRQAEIAYKTATEQAQRAKQALDRATIKRKHADIKCQKINDDFIKNIERLDASDNLRGTPAYTNKRTQLDSDVQPLISNARKEQANSTAEEQEKQTALTSALEAQISAVENLAAKETIQQTAWNKLMAAKKLVAEQGLYDPPRPTSPKF